MMSNLFWLTDAEMARLPPFFPKSHDKPHVVDRSVLSGIIFINHNGVPWCDAHREYGPLTTLYNRCGRSGEKMRLRPDDGRPGVRGVSSEDNDDRLYLFEGTLHGDQPSVVFPNLRLYV